MSDFWLGWYNTEPLETFELHSPYWVSGYRGDDETMVAAVRAESEEDAWNQITQAYDSPPVDIEQRFIGPLDRSPFSDRFPAAEWMAWEPNRTCNCATHGISND